MIFITDRTEADVIIGNEKGVYGYSDLNRVESAVQSIVESGIAQDLITKTDWGLVNNFSVEEWPAEKQMKRYLGNVATIRDVFAVDVEIPASMDMLDWNGANNIERVLQIAIGRVSGVIQSYRYSGDTFSGEDIL